MDDRSKIEDRRSSAPLKRMRGPGSAIHVPSCLVDGCRSDLGKCRDYHRRHKVCEIHSKTPRVTISGQEQRFCQQCSRFHSLAEFDEEKRSCRKRLDGHNRRRRKPQPEASALDSGRFLSTYQGTRFLPFHSPHVFPSAEMGSSLVLSANPESNSLSLYDARPQSIITRINPCFPGKEISFLQSPSRHVPSNNSGGSQRAWLHRDNSFDSNCALSLLSSTPTGSSTSSSKAHHRHRHMVQPNSPSSEAALGAQSSLIPGGLHYHGSGLGMAGEQLVINDGGESGAGLFHCQDMFRIGSSGSSTSSGGPHHYRLHP